MRILLVSDEALRAVGGDVCLPAQSLEIVQTRRGHVED
jgi:hypothetical protein